MIVHKVDPKHDPALEPDGTLALPSKEAPRQYASLAKRNIFTGPLPPPAPEIVQKPTPPPAPDYDIREHVRLVFTDTTNQEAFLRNFVFNEREKRLRTDPKSGHATFTIRDENGKDVLKGKVLRIDQRDVYFLVGEDVFGIHIGESLAHAMRRPLSDEELKSRDLMELIDDDEPKKKEAPSKKAKK
jgi:hypothetical protein